MYNRYISDRHGDDNFVPASSLQDFQIPVSRSQNRSEPSEPRMSENRMSEGRITESPKAAAAISHNKSILDNSILGNLFGKKDGKTGLLGGLFGGLNLNDLDIGDLILILILILMFIDSDEYDFLIIVGLIVILGL
jgi:hypothetical protein